MGNTDDKPLVALGRIATIVEKGIKKGNEYIQTLMSTSERK